MREENGIPLAYGTPIFSTLSSVGIRQEKETLDESSSCCSSVYVMPPPRVPTSSSVSSFQFSSKEDIKVAKPMKMMDPSAVSASPADEQAATPTPTPTKAETTTTGPAAVDCPMLRLMQHQEFLQDEQGYTQGLTEALLKNTQIFSQRMWVVDNSGSMVASDGHRIVTDEEETIWRRIKSVITTSCSGNNSTKDKKKMKKRPIRFVPCTRWAEMQQAVLYHAEMAAQMQAPTTFRMLNDPGRANGPQQFSVGEPKKQQQQQHKRASGGGGDFLKNHDLVVAETTLKNTTPSGVTPLAKHVRDIRSEIVDMEPWLREHGTKVAVVIATDGVPTTTHEYASTTSADTLAAENDFLEAMQSLQGLPVWIVVRLCTDEPATVNFWNQLDRQLELNLDVMDDYATEAASVYAHNPWLNYGLPLHRLREMGFYHRVLDMLDERQLTKDELYDFCRLLFGNKAMEGGGSDEAGAVPDPQSNWNGFVRRVAKLVAREEKTWNPVSQKMEPWINLRELRKEYPRPSIFSCCCSGDPQHASVIQKK